MLPVLRYKSIGDGPCYNFAYTYHQYCELSVLIVHCLYFVIISVKKYNQCGIKYIHILIPSILIHIGTSNIVREIMSLP